MSAGFLVSVVQALAAFACLTSAYLLWRRDTHAPSRALVIAGLGTTAAHLLVSTPGIIDPAGIWLVTALRNLVWLGVIRALFAADGRHASLRPVGPLLVALALAELLQVPLAVMAGIFPVPVAFSLTAKISAIFHLLFAIGTLVLIHNLYGGAGPQQRPRIKWMAGALVVAWGTELNIFAASYLWGELPVAMNLLRAAAWTVAAFFLWLDGRQKGAREFSPSRTVTFQSLSLIVIALYLFALFTIDGAVTGDDPGLGIVGRFGAVVFAVAIGAILASRNLRVWLRDLLVRNLFRHRYDYREEWLRLSATIGATSAPAEQRTVQALADIVDSPAGFLLSPGDEGAFELSANWHWPTLEVPATGVPDMVARMIACDGGVIELDKVRAGHQPFGGHHLPQWLMSLARAWLLVPLQVDGRTTGMIVLARPAYVRDLDWEDHDLLRIVGQQLAAHLSQNQAQKALLESARFDEFNRRMAFVMHDIKNLASQFGLLVSNAERHIEKPAFRADMLVTLRAATKRLEGLIGRLSNYGTNGVGAPSPISPLDAVRTALQAEITSDLIEIGHGGGAALLGDREALETVLKHLVRNAIEASEDGAKVEIHFPGTDRMAGVAVVDSGCGMSPEFIRSGLFKPFVSTKNNGFGIGAYEARELVRAMGGRLEVESRIGEGSRFVIWLPRAAEQADEDRKVA